MIDKAKLGGMRQRSDAARPAVEAVAIRDGGLYADQPIDDPVGLLWLAAGSAADVPALLDECERLAPASYVHGPEQCVDGDCEHEYPPDGQWCSHVTERVATFDDVKRVEYLTRLVGSIRERLVDDENTDEIVADLDAALEAMEAAESAGWAH